MVFLLRKRRLVSNPKSISHGSSQSEGATQAAPTTSPTATKNSENTHVCVLSVDASSRDNPGLLLIFIEDNRVGIDALLEDLEAGLVGDAVAVAKGRGACMLSSGHKTEAGVVSRENKLEKTVDLEGNVGDGDGAGALCRRPGLWLGFPGSARGCKQLRGR